MEYFIGGFIGMCNRAYIYNSINFGNVSNSLSNNNIGAIIGDPIVEYNEYQNVYYTSIIKLSDVNIIGVEVGENIDDVSIITNSFFIDTLGWDLDIWEISNINTENGLYPTLIINN
jgi:hypothetical protein